VRIHDFNPDTMVIPNPEPGMSTSAVLYKAGIINAGDGPDKLRSIKVTIVSGVRRVIAREEGPILIEVLQLRHLREAPMVHDLLHAKQEEG
jgi:hypothetical protein